MRDDISKIFKTHYTIPGNALVFPISEISLIKSNYKLLRQIGLLKNSRYNLEDHHFTGHAPFHRFSLPVDLKVNPSSTSGPRNPHGARNE